jgi:hypothetical protein
MDSSMEAQRFCGEPAPPERHVSSVSSHVTAQRLLPRPARGFVRFLYSSNPFYIVSADLVFVGLRISFGRGGPASESWALLLGLAGYTLLLATTACFLIRAGKLWDDLRSLLLLIVMMFLAMAMSNDDTMAADAVRGSLGYLGGFLFAVVVTEAVLSAISLRLPGWYRAAYYVILGLVFLYPIALVPVLSEPESPRLQWGLFGFSVLAGLALLPLVPAARGGAAFVAKNGSPWRWPLYPWSLFFVMACCLGVRCSSLCISFHFVNGRDSIFGRYFLVPIGLAASLVWLEIGISARRRAVMVAASAAPFALVVAALTGHRYDAVYMNFLDLLRATLGASPAFLALTAAILFLVYAAARRVPPALDLLAAAFVMLSAIGPATVGLHDMESIRPLPLAAAGLVLGSVALWRRHSFRGATAAGLFVAALAGACSRLWPHVSAGAITLHLAVVALLAVGALFDDWLAARARLAGAIALLVLGLIAAFRPDMIDSALPALLAPWYPLGVASLLFGYGLVVRDRPYAALGAGVVVAWAAASGIQVYAQMRRILTGLDQIAWGMLFFLVAIAISLSKAGLWPRAVPPRWLAWLVRGRDRGCGP